MGVPIASTTRKSTLYFYHLVWGLWIGLSLVYTAGYWHVAVLSGRLLQGLVLASAFLVQAFLVSAFALRQRFSSCAGAAIQSATAAVGVVGLPASLLVLTETSFRHFAVSISIDGLQFGYVVTILLLSGVAGGTALGILRWRILQAEPVQANAEPSCSWWKRYLRSAMPWVASVTLYSWLIGAISWAMSSSDRDKILPPAVLLGIVGLLFIAPIPVLSRAPEGDSRWKRIWRYFKLAMRPVAIFVGMVSVILWPYALGYFPWFQITPFVVLGVPCLFWAVLCAGSVEPPSVGAKLSWGQLSSLRPELRDSSNWIIVGLCAASQVCALPAGLLAAAPVSLNSHAVGCLTVNPMGARAYWFWKAYKGLSSEVQTGKGMVLRPSVNASACVTLDERAMALISDPKEVSRGYLGAARVWSWLIDPEQWDAERTKQIRKELAPLLGRDFASYEELETWWKKNNNYLVWSGMGELLEVREQELSVRSEPSDDHLREPYVYISSAGRNSSAPWIFGREPLGNGPNPQEFPLFGDREARLRGLKLDAASSIEIVTGEQQHRIQEYLHDLFKEDFSTKTEWQEFFARSPRQNPWRVRRSEAEQRVALLQRNRSTPGNIEKNEVMILQMETGLTYSRVDDFIEWLQNPENTRYGEWENAEKVFRAAYDGPEFLSNKRFALDWLKLITDQTFDSPEKWVQWWQENRSNLVLSEDGQKLVSKSK